MSINFKIVTYIQHVLDVTWSNIGEIGQRSRSYWYIMYTVKMCNNSVLGDRILFILGWNIL